MLIDAQSSWDKLAIEVELLNTEDPSSLIQMMVGLNGLLWPDESMEWTARSINFLTYDLMARSEKLDEADRLQFLNEEFFEKKAFQVAPLGPTTDHHLLIKPVTERRLGLPIAIAMIYMHLASHLDLPAYLLQLKNQFLLKWVRRGTVNYIDLLTQGRVLTEPELIAIMQHQGPISDEQSFDLLSALPNRKLFSDYLSLLAESYEANDQHSELHLVYNVLLKMEPQHCGYLGRRALLRQKLGLHREALADLKQFFAYVDHKSAPQELRSAYEGLLH